MPFLAGTAADAARDRLRAIAEALRDHAAEPVVNLAVGKAGIALCLANAGRVLDDDSLVDASLDWLAPAMESPHPAASLAGGAFGVAWVAEQLVALGVVDDDGEANAAADALLDARLDRRDPEDDWDLFNGWLGIGVYALARKHRLGSVITRLRELGPDGIWFRSREMLPLNSRPIFPGGHYNFGISHGQAAIVGFLADAALPEARPMLESAAHALLATRGRVLDPDRRALPASTTNWCYGDTGIEGWSYGDLSRALALLAAARVLDRDDIERAAIAIALAAADADPSTNPWTGLCHGRIGVAYVLARLHQATGLPVFADRARAWFRATWQLFDEQGGVAAYLTRVDDPLDERGPGILEGLAGLGLATMALLDDDRRWETMMAVGATALGRQ